MPYYYVSIRYLSKENSLKRKGSYGLSEDEVKTRYTEKFGNREDVTIRGYRIPYNMIDAIQVFKTDKKISEIAKEISLSEASVCKNVSSQFVRGNSSANKINSTNSPNPRIFIIHGRSEQPKDDLADFLTDCGLQPVILSEEPNRGRTIIEKLECSNVGYAFAILTPDDEGCLCGTLDRLMQEKSEEKTFGKLKIGSPNLEKIRSQVKLRARQNVILEFGFFIAKLGRDKVCYIHQGNLEVPSDIHGIGYLEFKKSIADCYNGIIKELKAAGYKLNL
jgi:predicted nucleotide-binding protein